MLARSFTQEVREGYQFSFVGAKPSFRGAPPGQVPGEQPRYPAFLGTAHAQFDVGLRALNMVGIIGLSIDTRSRPGTETWEDRKRPV
jgi:hypothetical protein